VSKIKNFMLISDLKEYFRKQDRKSRSRKLFFLGTILDKQFSGIFLFGVLFLKCFFRPVISKKNMHILTPILTYIEREKISLLERTFSYFVDTKEILNCNTNFENENKILLLFVLVF
jgi:hypothetical protein